MIDDTLVECHHADKGFRNAPLPPTQRPSRTRPHREILGGVTYCSWLIPQLHQELRAGEHIDNTVCPHQTLHSLTPQQFLLRKQSQR